MKLFPVFGLAMLAMPFAPLCAENQLEEVIITASPHQKSAQQVAGSFNVISDEQLQLEAAATLGDTLANQVGVASSSFGPGVGSPIIRGLGGKRVEILQNSTVVGDASDISPDHAIATEALLADRIEILRGPATLRFGPGAIGGVINVIDNRIHTTAFEGVEGAIETRHSSNNDATAIVSRLDAGTGTFNLHLDAVTRDSNNVEIRGLAAPADDDSSNGFIANTDAKADSFSAGLSWVRDNIVFGLSLSQLDNNYGLPPGGHGHGDEHHEDEHEEDHEEGHEEDHEEEETHEGEEHSESDINVRIDMQQRSYQSKLLINELGAFFDRLEVDLSHTEYEHAELEQSDALSSVGSLITANSQDFRAELTHAERSGWLGTMGLQLNARDFGSSGEEAFILPSKTTRQGLYWIEETSLPLGDLELGLRVDEQTIDGFASVGKFSHNSLNMSASWIVPLNDQHRLSLIVSRSERAPAAEELLSGGEHIATNSYEIGDQTLTTESANNLEITWMYARPAFDVRVSAYYNRFNDFIDLRDTGLSFSHDLEDVGFSGIQACSAAITDFDDSAEELEEAIGCFVYQQQDAEFSGIELESSLILSDSQKLQLQADLVRGSFSSGSNRDVPRLPPQKLRASWIVENGLYRGSVNITHAAAQDRAGENQEGTNGYTKLDASLAYTQDNWSAFIKGQNLTNQEIRNSSSFLRDIAPEAGRKLTVGLRYRF